MGSWLAGACAAGCAGAAAWTCGAGGGRPVERPGAVRRLVRLGAVVGLAVADLPLLQLGDLLLLLVDDPLCHPPELLVGAVLQLRPGEEDQVLVVGDEQRGEILVGVADELRVLEAVVHDLADALDRQPVPPWRAAPAQDGSSRR